MKKDKDQLQQEQAMVEGDSYREKSTPSKVKNKNTKLRSLKNKLDHEEKEYNSYLHRSKSTNSSMRWMYDSILSHSKNRIDKLKKEIAKLEEG